jgi:hypothetical protein
MPRAPFARNLLGVSAARRAEAAGAFGRSAPRATRLGAWSLLVALTLGLGGCSHGSSRLAGRWRGLHPEGVSPLVGEATMAFATHTRLEVKGDTLTLTTPDQTRTDRYRVVLEDASKTVISTASDGEKSTETFSFSDAKTMRWAVAPGVSILFTKE